jgi:serine/threonine-protein kinase
MFMQIFKKDEAKPVTEIKESVHNEPTQKISKKPALGDLTSGNFLCVHCGTAMPLAEYVPLALYRCPLCGTPNFTPYLIKDYWLYEPLGGGGMGSVYRAFHRMNPTVELAVKILPRDKKGNPTLIAALLNEAGTGRQFGEHPHLAKVYEYGQTGDEYFAVFEFVDGIRLDQIIDSPVRPPNKQIALWALQILSAEQHIYDRGFLFRDLKPQNIMIDNNGNVKLIDYGLAMRVEKAASEDPSTDEIQGSPYYMPPERIVGSGEGQFSEIYSLGMVIYHVLAKQPFYSSDDIKKLVGKHVVSLRINNVMCKLPAQTNPDLAKMLTIMIDRDPRRRYQTYKEAGKEFYTFYQKCA